MTTLQEKFYQEIKANKGKIKRFYDVSIAMTKTVTLYTDFLEFVITPHKNNFDLMAFENGTHKTIFMADFIPYKTYTGMITKLLNKVNTIVLDYDSKKIVEKKREIKLLHSFSKPQTKVYLFISPKNEALFDCFDEEITDTEDLKCRPYSTEYMTDEEKEELTDVKELITEKLKTVDIVQVLPRN